MGISQLYTRLIKPNPYQKEAHAALRRARRLEGQERSQSLHEGFEEVSRSFAEEPLAGSVLELARAISRASQRECTEALQETALQLLSDGVQNTGAYLATASLQLLEAAQLPRRDRGTALSGLVSVVGRRAEDAAVLTSLALAGGAAAGSPEAPLRSALATLAAGGAPLAAVAVSLVMESSYSDRGAVAQAVLANLAASGEHPLAELAVAAFQNTRDAETRSAVAREAVDLLGSEPRPGLGACAARLIKRARAERDQEGRWQDGKTPVALACLDFFARRAQDETRREFAAATATACRSMAFTQSVAGVAAEALEAMDEHLDEAGLASTLRQMVRGASDSKTAEGSYRFDKATLVTAVLPFLKAHIEQPESQVVLGLWGAANHSVTFSTSREQLALASLEAISTGQTEPGALALRMMQLATTGKSADGRFFDDQLAVARAAAGHLPGRQAALTGAVLEGTKFGESNQAIARAGFNAIAAGRGDTEAELAVTLREMVEGALDARDADGNFRADKVAAAAHGRAFMLAGDPAPETRRVLELWQAAATATSFSTTSESLARLALGAIADGKSGDQVLGKLGAAMVEQATSSNDLEGNYHDDKGKVAKAVANFLVASGETADRERGELFLKATAGTAFRETKHALAQVIFRAPSADLGELGKALLEAAYATTATDGKYHDDKSIVAVNLLNRARAAPSATEQDRRAAAVALKAIGSCQFTRSAVAVAEVALGLQGAAQDPERLAAALTGMIKSGAVSDGRQDQGPIAVAVFTALGELAADAPQQAMHAVLAGMMNNGSSHLERVKVAEVGLTLWGAGERPDVRPLAERVLAQVSSQDDRRKMLAGACRSLASADQSRRVQEVLAGDPRETELLELLQELAPGTREQVQELAEALKARGEGEIQIEEDSVWISDFELEVNAEP